jgi:uncharacterized phiE125 gp8 family phage protein
VPITADPIITTTEAKDFLNITSSALDAELSLFINAASQVIVNRIGPVSGSPTVSEWHDGGSPRIVLRQQTPIQSVTSVTESYGTVTYTLTAVVLDQSPAVTAYGYSVDLDRGLIIRRASGVAVPFAAGTSNVHVTYVAGYATVPEDIKHAAKLLLKHMWDTQRAGRPGAGPEPTAAYTLPRRVEEILAPHIIPGIA